MIRHAIRKEQKIQISYKDAKGDESLRIIWPLALGFFEEVHVVVAWCELRQEFRHFRTDRLLSLIKLKSGYPKRRKIFLKTWREIHKIPEQL